MDILILILAILGLLLSFVVLAKVCDVFFIDSLDLIAKKWKMSSDAAGATLMAVGSSAPELFVALFAVIPKKDHETGLLIDNAALGVGNIVGSAIFNILVITGAVGLVKKSKLAWRPIIRDLAFYAISIALLIGVFYFRDYFGYLETITFLAFYTIYVIVVIRWRKMFPPSKLEIELEKAGNAEKEPDAKKELKWWQKFTKKHYYIVFLLSILVIAGASWVLVETAVHLAEHFHIPPAIVGLTVLAVGTSVPDLISSIIVAKKNRGGMAISNGVGSNIFDILVGLGLPFLVMILISGRKVVAEAGNLLTSSIILFGTVVIVLLTFMLSKWKIGKFIGAFFILLYLAYVVWQITLIV